MQTTPIRQETLDMLPAALREWVEECSDSMADDPLGWFESESPPAEHLCLWEAIQDVLAYGLHHQFSYPAGLTAREWKSLYREAEKHASGMKAKYGDELPAGE